MPTSAPEMLRGIARLEIVARDCRVALRDALVRFSDLVLASPEPQRYEPVLDRTMEAEAAVSRLIQEAEKR